MSDNQTFYRFVCTHTSNGQVADILEWQHESLVDPKRMRSHAAFMTRDSDGQLNYRVETAVFSGKVASLAKLRAVLAGLKKRVEEAVEETHGRPYNFQTSMFEESKDLYNALYYFLDALPYAENFRPESWGNDPDYETPFDQLLEAFHNQIFCLNTWDLVKHLIKPELDQIDILTIALFS